MKTMPAYTCDIWTKVVVFCDEGFSDWEHNFKPQFEKNSINFKNIQVFDSPKAFTESCGIFMFDWGGMSVGNNVLEHFIRWLIKNALDNPGTDFVLLSRFTDYAYRDYLEYLTEEEKVKLSNVYTLDKYITKLTGHGK